MTEKNDKPVKLIFTIPLDKVKINGDQVYFELYANGELAGGLIMTQAEFKCFQATIVDDERYSNNVQLGMIVGEHVSMIQRGWKILSVERMKFWKKSGFGYEQKIKKAGDFSFEEALKIVREANVALHSEPSKILGAEEILVYSPSED